jgi:hypothetical protein
MSELCHRRCDEMFGANGAQSSLVDKFMVCLRRSVGKQPANVIADCASGRSFCQTQTHCVKLA